MVASWPTPAALRDLAAEAEWNDVMALTRAARTLRSDYRVEAARTVPATIVTDGDSAARFWRTNADLVGALPGTRLAPVQVVEMADEDLAARSIATVAGGAELLIPAEGLFDVHAELTRATQEFADAEKQVGR